MQKLIKNVLYILILAGVCFFFAIVLSFSIYLLLTGGSGLLPIFEFFPYAFNMMFGNWGESYNLLPGAPVNDLIASKLPRSFDILLLPLILGLVIGILLGYVSIRSRFHLLNRIIQLFSYFTFAIPIILLAPLMQYVYGYVNPVFPPSGFKTVTYLDPPLITGFRFIDSLLSGQYELAFDYLYHLLLPWIIMLITITVFMTAITRIYLINRSKSNLITQSIVPFVFVTGLSIGMIFTLLTLTEITFRLSGFTQLLIDAINVFDYLVINGALFYIFMNFGFVLMMFSLLFLLFYESKSLYRMKRPSKKRLNKEEVTDIINFNQSPQRDIKSNGLFERFKEEGKNYLSYLINRLKSPFTLFGLALIIFIAILPIFPNILTPYSFSEALGIYPDPWAPPSPDHPLGQTQFGRDVLARIIYSLPNSLLIGTFSVLVGLIVGLIIGIPLILIKRKLKIPFELLIIPFFIVPMILTFIFKYDVYDFGFHLVPYLGLYTMPFFTYLIAKARLSVSKILKRVTPYIPLFIGLTIMIYNFIAYIGIQDHTLITLGGEMEEARAYMHIAPHAMIFPGIALFIVLLGFFVLYMGLQKPPSAIQTEFR